MLRGLGVYVDKATYKKYRATPGLRRAAAEHIERNPDACDNFMYARLKFGEGHCCPFLSVEKICSIQQQYGAEFLSKTCSRYPRALARFDGKMQTALYLSCPEAARLVLLSPQLLPQQDAPRYHEFTLKQPQNPALSSTDLLRTLRAFALDLLQDHTYPLWQRLFLLGIVCRRSHELIAANAAFQIPQLLAEYATMILDGRLRPQMDGIPARPCLQLELVLKLMQRRLQVDQPPQAFASCIANFLMVTGYSSGAPLPETAARYHEGYLRDYQPFERAFPLFMENYLLNFVFRTRFPFADAPCHIQHHIDPLGSSLLLLLHYRLLHSLLIGEAARCGATFSTAGAVRVVQGFARGVEHNVKFHDDLMIFARSPELQKSDGLAVLVRN